MVLGKGEICLPIGQCSRSYKNPIFYGSCVNIDHGIKAMRIRVGYYQGISMGLLRFRVSPALVH